MEKYSKPSLPNPQSVVEDLTALGVDLIDVKETFKYTPGDEGLRDAYNIYFNFKQLTKDITEQQELHGTLEELNKQLMDNIESMRKQQF